MIKIIITLNIMMMRMMMIFLSLLFVAVFPMFVGFEANKAAEGEHLAQTLPAKNIAGKKTLLAKKYCRQKNIAGKKTLPAN